MTFNPKINSLFVVLDVIASNNKPNALTIAHQSRVTYSHLLSMLNEMHIRSLIKTEQISRREVNYSLTDRGIDLLLQLRKLMEINNCWQP